MLFPWVQRKICPVILCFAPITHTTRLLLQNVQLSKILAFTITSGEKKKGNTVGTTKALSKELVILFEYQEMFGITFPASYSSHKVLMKEKVWKVTLKGMSYVF